MTDDTENLEAMLADYVDGHLGGAEAREAEAYLDAHPDARSAVRRLMADSEALRSLPPVVAPIDFSEEYRGQVERDLLLGDAGVKASRPSAFSVPVAAIAAILVVAVGMSGIAYWLLARRPPSSLDVAYRSAEKEVGTAPKEPASAEDLRSIVAPKQSSPNERVASVAAPLFQDGQLTPVDASGGVSARADARRGESKADDTLLTLTPPATTTKPLSDLSAPTADVARLLEGQRSLGRRAVVLVVNPADPGVAARTLDALDAATPSTAGPGDAFARVTAEHPIDDASARDRAAGLTRNAPSNAAEQSPVADAITTDKDKLSEAETAGVDVRVARGVSESAAAALDASVREAAGVANVEAFALARRLDGYVDLKAAIAQPEMPATMPALTAATRPAPAEVQQFSGQLEPRTMQSSATPNGDDGLLDVFVVVRPPHFTTQPTTRTAVLSPVPSTTQPATTRAAG